MAPAQWRLVFPSDALVHLLRVFWSHPNIYPIAVPTGVLAWARVCVSARSILVDGFSETFAKLTMWKPPTDCSVVAR
jgi:hypothetical protein